MTTDNKNQLDIGMIGYKALKYHMEDALKEFNMDSNLASDSPPIAIFSHQYYRDLYVLDRTKKYDYCFIGSIKSAENERKWIIEFAKNKFTANSYFINTDKPKNWTKLGSFDKTNENIGYNPKVMQNNQSRDVQFRYVHENLYYFNIMAQSKFILCPRGDAPWSFRFYESLMCGAIPIVQTWHHTYRTAEESVIPYKYQLSNQETFQYNDDIVKENDTIFQKYHLLKPFTLDEKNLMDYIYYESFHMDLHKKSHKDLYNHYINYGHNEDRVWNDIIFREKYPQFSCDIYRKYDDLKHFSDRELKRHYYVHGRFEKRICS